MENDNGTSTCSSGTNVSTSFCARRDEWGRIFGDWVPATRLGPGRLSISANRGHSKDTKNRAVIIGSAVSARDSSDKYSQGNGAYFFRGEACLFAYANIPPLRTRLNKTVV